MQPERTLLLRRSEIEDVLSLRDCIDAIEEVFRLQGHGKIPSSEILGVKAPNGGLHVKAALLPRGRSYIVAKLNTNFPVNRTQSRLPTIQGLIAVYDAEDGRPLAVLDSIDITIKRTAAASAVAAKYLARRNSSVATICGCGGQARAQLRAIHSVLATRGLAMLSTNERCCRHRSRSQRLDRLPPEDRRPYARTRGDNPSPQTGLWLSRRNHRGRTKRTEKTGPFLRGQGRL